MRHFILMLIVLFTFLPSASAQDEPCDITAITAEYATLLSSAATLEEADALIPQLQTALNQCRPIAVVEPAFVLSGDSDTVHDPIEIPTDIYRLRVVSNSAVSAEVTLLDGDCGFVTPSMYMATGQAVGGADTGFYSNFCKAIFQIDASEAYTIEFLPMDRTARTQSLSFTGNNWAVLGVVEISAGIYKVTIDTESSYPTMTGILVEGDCDNGFNVISTKEQVFQSAGCAILLELRNVAGEWAVNFEKLD